MTREKFGDKLIDTLHKLRKEFSYVMFLGCFSPWMASGSLFQMGASRLYDVTEVVNFFVEEEASASFNGHWASDKMSRTEEEWEHRSGID